MKKISEDLLQGINIGVAIGLALSENKANAIEIYKNIMENSTLPTSELEKNFCSMIKKHALNDFESKNYENAILQYLDIFKNTELEPSEYLNLATSLIELNQPEIAIKFLDLYDKLGTNDFLTQKNLGWIYFSALKNYEKAIHHYENAIQIYPKDADTYNVLGHIYALHHKDKQLEKQLQYFLSAHNLKKNTRLYIRNIIFTLYRLQRYEDVEIYYKKLFNLNPEQNDYYFYGCFLISQKRFKEGYKYLQARFKKESDPSIIPAVLPSEKYWHGENLLNKTILVHCEQGFGDTILYSRFIKILSKQAKKVYFVVQDELLGLMINSNLGAEIYSTNFELAKLNYDYFTTTIDLPLHLDFDCKELPFKTGYLKTAKTEAIKKSGYKIGFAFEGNEKLKDNARDINLEFLAPIFDIPDIEFYSLQVGSNVKLPQTITDLGISFKNFNDTANAIATLDLIISTDNAVMNLAGALGKPTIGLFNRFVDYRWCDIKDKESLNWYESITVFQNKTQDNWAPTIRRVIDEINRLRG